MDSKEPHLLLGALLPHPAILIPGVSDADLDQIRDTERALLHVSREIAQLAPDLVVIVSPHGPMFEDAATVMGGDVLRGDLHMFGSEQTFATTNDTELAQQLLANARSTGAPLYLFDDELKQEFELEMELDYGASIPYYFLQKAGYEGPILHLSPGFLPLEQLYRVGQLLQHTLHQLGRRAVIIASGDNSHALTEDAPEGLRKEGQLFDAFLHASLAAGHWLALLTQDETFLELAAEDTMRSLSVLLGAFDKQALHGEKVAYQAPFGIGYTVARFVPQESGVPSLLPQIQEHQRQKIATIRQNESSFVRLARVALETYVRDETWLEPPVPVPAKLDRQAGCFVSLYIHGQLRGCMGTVEPMTDNLAFEIIRNAIAAGTEDDRFFPVEADELEHLVYSLDILAPEEPVTDLADLDPALYGLIVIQEATGKSALLLPNLEGIRTAEDQVREVRAKAEIEPGDEDVAYYRFRVARYY